MLYNRDRGCTAPGCTAPAYHTEAHHARLDYAKGGQTNIPDLGLACPSHNHLVTEHGWTTRIRDDGRVEWIAPPLLESGQDRINNYWHPEELFHPPEDDDP
ncbi:HNH endonuclease signature motif containing protein [Mycolicibacterium wolinskyi]|uniref:HNH endonuclease signature motif containing protein n=1 Tax=Mycolicibacterium wolinskyi TaxID=59750 RepID=UPI00391774C5